MNQEIKQAKYGLIMRMIAIRFETVILVKKIENFFVIIITQSFKLIRILNTDQMKQKRVVKVDNERIKKLQIKETSVNLDWLLKQPNINEIQSTLQFISLIDLNIEIDNFDIQGVCHTVYNNQIQLKYISIANDLLIFQESNCVVLSGCVIQKRKFHSNHNQLFLISLQNQSGKLLLLFQHPISQKEWYKVLKLSAIQIDFLKKYRILDNICLNFYYVSHKKKKKKYAAQIINRKNFKLYDQQDVINNYIKILRNNNIQNVFPIISIFDENDILYLITEQFVGSAFEQLLSSQNTVITQSDLAFIIFSVLQNLKSLQDEDLFHGNLNLDNIVIINSSSQVGVYVINPIYKVYKSKSIEYYVHTIPDYLVAPEINDTQAPSVSSDIYQLGILLLLVSFQCASEKLDGSFVQKVLKNKQFLVSSQEIKFQKCQDSDYPHLYSACQLDLIKKMTEKDPTKRIQVQDAMKHAWFINTKDKLKMQKQYFNKHLPSLKTIIEMVEQSEQDIRRKSLQQSGINFTHQMVSIQKYEFSPYRQQQPEFSPLKKTSESLNEIVDEEHQISNLIDQLNNKQYLMLPSQYNHLNQANNQLRFIQSENNLDQFQV
ncbi:unnamed protein product (macronuclear) [Paramecium tetraurelia]|uniref:Protein kinase domain-containing protein n=1 Tax=Paramecium tetraurelia TaxID=5888 RepID=A0CIQ6_PARTE|nr:uncharacterized protein GSPATT00007808001 [Paramecium tetraurelia]CAK70673.1 unnamed protein product [Paramecium tetraurelia]|eukprot:XP_001438070.1 hypothetical protein (macronuclear) [Paramecium tetraurelia strain d4-2]